MVPCMLLGPFPFDLAHFWFRAKMMGGGTGCTQCPSCQKNFPVTYKNFQKKFSAHFIFYFCEPKHPFAGWAPKYLTRWGCAAHSLSPSNIGTSTYPIICKRSKGKTSISQRFFGSFTRIHYTWRITLLLMGRFGTPFGSGNNITYIDRKFCHPSIDQKLPVWSITDSWNISLLRQRKHDFYNLSL